MKPLLDALYGDRGPITGLPCWDVLSMAACLRDENLVEAKTQREYGQAMQA